LSILCFAFVRAINFKVDAVGDGRVCVCSCFTIFNDGVDPGEPWFLSDSA